MLCRWCLTAVEEVEGLQPEHDMLPGSSRTPC